METDDPLRPAGRGGDLRHRERGRVRREDARARCDVVELGGERPLRLEVLDDRLDYQIAGAERAELRRERQPSERSISLLRGDSLLLDRTAEVMADPVVGPLAELDADVHADRLETGLRADLGDSGSHRSEAHDADRANVSGRRGHG